VQHYLITPGFKFFLSCVGTSSFYFLGMHRAYLTEKNSARSTHCHSVSLNKVKLEGLYWNAVQNDSDL